MSKQKKNSNSHGMQIRMQQRRNQIENEQYHTILRILRACDAYVEFMQLPPEVQRFVKKVQIRSIQIKAEKGSGISDSIVSAIKKDLSNYLHSEKVILEGTNEEFTMYDMVTAGQTLWQLSFCSEEKKWQAVYEQLKSLITFFENDNTFFVKVILTFLDTLVNKFSSVSKYFLWFTWDIVVKDEKCVCIFTMHRQNCIRKHIVIDQKPRPVYRVGYGCQEKGLKWATVKGALLLPFCSSADKEREYPVFVQSHALARMKERLFPITSYELVLNLSFINIEISSGVGGGLFFSVKTVGCKLGYLLADFNGNEIVVRSFLFITNNGTPEGYAFNERLRVAPYSKKYFGLDSLLAYIITDICTDPFFCSVLKECGCDGLVNYKKFFLQFTCDDKFSANLRKELAIVEEERELELQEQGRV